MIEQEEQIELLATDLREEILKSLEERNDLVAGQIAYALCFLRVVEFQDSKKGLADRKSFPAIVTLDYSFKRGNSTFYPSAMWKKWDTENRKTIYYAEEEYPSMLKSRAERLIEKEGFTELEPLVQNSLPKDFFEGTGILTYLNALTADKYIEFFGEQNGFLDMCQHLLLK
jgi:hypothetical protein